MNRIFCMILMMAALTAGADLTVKVPSDVEAGKPFKAEIIPLNRMGEVYSAFKAKVKLSVEGKIEAVDVPIKLQSEKNHESKQVILEFMKGEHELSLADPGWYRVTVTDGKSTAHCPVRVHAKKPEYRLLWGEIHTHSSFCNDSSKGAFAPYKTYVWGREVGALDFGTVVAHHWSIDETKWKRLMEVHNMHNRPGEFLTLAGYEWGQGASIGSRWNHNNVYFLSGKGPLCSNRSHVKDLWTFLDGKARGQRVLAIPHHPALKGIRTPWNDERVYSPKYHSVLEIYSSHGNSECKGAMHQGKCDWEEGYVHNALSQGYIFGFIAGSDNHGGRMGTESRLGHRKNGIPSGIAAVHVKEHSRKGLWVGLQERYTYGTSGSKRILVDFSVDGKRMGSVIPTRKRRPRLLKVEVGGTADIDKIEVLKNNEVIHTEPGKGWHMNLELKDKPSKNPYDYYYVRIVQKDKNLAWSSPVWIGLIKSPPPKR